jgi:hypothetical protein
MKKLLFICTIFLAGCYEHVPDPIKASIAAEMFLENLYQPIKIDEEEQLDFITIKEYLNPSKQKIFQKENTYHHLSANGWDIFTKKINDISVKGKTRINSIITIESYKFKGTKYTMAFIVDSPFRKVFATIPIDQLPAQATK